MNYDVGHMHARQLIIWQPTKSKLVYCISSTLQERDT